MSKELNQTLTTGGMTPKRTVKETIEYLPDANYEGLLAQFNELKQELLSKNYFKDSLKLDSFGWVKVKDTIQKNTITGRSWEYNIKYPEVTTVITKPPKLTRQLFIGGEIGGSKLKPIDNVGASLLYKDRKDRIFGIGVNKKPIMSSPVSHGVLTNTKCLYFPCLNILS